MAREERVFREHAAATGRLMADWDAAFGMWLTKSTPTKTVTRVGRVEPAPARAYPEGEVPW